MEQNLTLKPEELYFLGSVLRAKYIDYAYVAAMDDISKNRGVYESEARRVLTDAGVITEDFSGGLEVAENAKALLRPVFFGEYEACIDISFMSEMQMAATVRFHSLDGTITQVIGTAEGKLMLSSVTKEDIGKIVKSLLPPDYPAVQPETADEIPRESVSRIIAVKHSYIGKSAAVKLFAESNGILYSETESGQAQSLSAEMFEEQVRGILKEVL